MSSTQRYYKFQVDPVGFVSLKKNAAETKASTDFNQYKKELRRHARAQNFKPSKAMKIIFIIPAPFFWGEKRIASAIGNFHTTTEKNKLTLARLIEGIRQVFHVDQESDLCRVEASKYWGERGCIIIKHIPEEDFDYLKHGME